MSVTDDLTAFEKDLHARMLLDTARDVCAPFGLRPDDLKRKQPRKRPGKPVLRPRPATPVIAEARARFARRLVERGWSTRMVAALLGYKNHSIVYYMLGEGAEERRERSTRRAQKFADVAPDAPRPNVPGERGFAGRVTYSCPKHGFVIWCECGKPES